MAPDQKMAALAAFCDAEAPAREARPAKPKTTSESEGFSEESYEGVDIAKWLEEGILHEDSSDMQLEGYD
jgi:hypothetical protein